MTTIDFARIRSAPKSRNDSFEALAVHLFRQSYPAPKGSRFFALRGEGGDGGVEAYFVAPNGEIAGVQAKYFMKLGPAELAQIDGSLTTALANHPALRIYWVYVPFNLTGRKAAGKLGQSETERFELWRSRRIQEAKARGNTLAIELVPAQAIQDQIHTVDAHGGVRRYWFDDAVLSHDQIEAGLNQSRQYAGPRYTAELDVRTDAHDALDFFSGIGDLKEWIGRMVGPLKVQARELTRSSERALGLLAAAEREEVQGLLGMLSTRLSAIRDADQMAERMNEIFGLVDLIEPRAQQARELQERAFRAEHGEGKDTPGFRQWMAEYMVQFPAAGMDAARNLCEVLMEVRALTRDPVIVALTSQSLLLVGPAGIGKTHAIVSAAGRRLEKGGFTLVVFGDDFQGPEPWEVIRSKLGFGANVGRSELFECLNACAANTGLPFLLAIDALNESPRNARWKDKLPELIAQVRPYPGIRLCVSARDAYLSDHVDVRFPGLAFEAPGFAGREFLALQAFAAHYKLAAGIAPLLASELTNPLYLHLACQALKDQGHTALDLSLPGFLKLLETHLGRVDKSVRAVLRYRNPTNLIRAALLSLADQLISGGADAATWDACVTRLKGDIDSEVSPSELLDQLQRENLLILTESEPGTWQVRLAFQRYGDFLRATRLVEFCFDGSGKFMFDMLSDRLSAIVAERPGLLEALAVVLPERCGVELLDGRIGLDFHEAAPHFVKGLLWRSRSSISHRIDDDLARCLSVGVAVHAVEALFKLSLVPDHPLNAHGFLHEFFVRQPMVERDPFLSSVAFKSFEDKGAVYSLLAACLRADVGLWPEESSRLAVCCMGWLCSVADRRVRDRATKALVRIISLRPQVATALIARFEGIDDDYILESVALAVYGAALISSRPQQEFLPALDAFLITAPRLESNVLVRDHIVLLASLLGQAARRAAELAQLRTPCALPNPWPTETDVKPLLTLDGLPSNMQIIGNRLLPDFWRYKVEPLLRSFDLKAAGVSNTNLGAWILAEVLGMGYPGREGRALAYDRGILGEFGAGRSRPGYAERLGKKYSWIALHRLVALLSDHMPLRAGWSGEVPDRDRLWSLELRKMDPTDLRDLGSEPAYPDEVLAGPNYVFPDRDSDLLEWVRTAEFTPHETCLTRTDALGGEWATLAMSADDDDLREDEESMSTTHLRVSLFYISRFAPQRTGESGDLEKMQSGHGQAPSSYRTYLGEYPEGRAFLESMVCEEDPDGIESTEVSLLRGGEWEYEYAADQATVSLNAPAPSLVRELGLRWDHYRGWLDKDGRLAAFHVRAEERRGLFLRNDLLRAYLERTKARVLYRRFASVHVMTPRNNGPSADINVFLRPALGRPLEVLDERREVFGSRES